MKLAQLQEARYAGSDVIQLIRDIYDYHHKNKTEFGAPVQIEVDEPFAPALKAVQNAFGKGRIEKADSDDHWSDRPKGQIITAYWNLDKPKISIDMINYTDSYLLTVKNLSSEYEMSWEELQQYSDEELLGIDPE